MEKDYSNQIEKLIKLKSYEDAYCSIKNEINNCLRENQELRVKISDNGDYEWKQLHKESLLMNDAYIYKYERYLEQVLYYQLKELIHDIDRFIIKLKELELLVEKEQGDNDYWLFWHLPNVILSSLLYISDEEKVFFLFKNINNFSFLKQHETFSIMVDGFLKALTNSEYKKDVIKWSGFNTKKL